MGCHSEIWTDAPMLAPVRESLNAGQPLHCNRVHDLPDFVFFDHSIHINKGVGCSTCHGQVDEMPIMFQARTLYMKWCLECHRNPERFLRPASKIYDFSWQPPPDQLEQGKRLVAEYGIQTGQLTDCSICHR
jgi:cytochrome c peroxidase